MKLLPLFRISLAELFGIVTFVSLACVALLNASDTTAWIVGSLVWLMLIVAIAGTAVPAWAGRPFCGAFLGAALLHLVLTQYTARFGQNTYDVDLPTFYLIEFLWELVPREHWISSESLSAPLRNPGPLGSPFFHSGYVDPAELAHANFRGIATQLFSVAYGVLAGFIALGIARVNKGAQT